MTNAAFDSAIVGRPPAANASAAGAAGAWAGMPGGPRVFGETLERIPDPVSLVRTVRRATGMRDGAVVAAEVLDTLDVLREGAFWHLPYERRSCFTPGSLARLFRAAGFDVIDLRRAQDGQSVVLEARPAAAPTEPRFELEDDLLAVRAAVDGFPAAAERQAARWRRVLGETLADGNRVAVWGSLPQCAGFLSAINVGGDERVSCVVGASPPGQAGFLPGTGHRVVPPDVLAEFRPHMVIAMSSVDRDAARRALDAMGLQPGLMTV